MANMVVRTNVFALNAHRNLKNVGVDQQRASQRLSSGFRINSAADDAAGLAISEGMRAQIRGLDQASRNTQDGRSMILTTEGGLEEVSGMLQRVRELLVQAANDTNTQDQRNMIDQEVTQLGREIASMQNRVEFNTARVLAMGPNMTDSVVKAVSQMEISAHNVRNWTSEITDQRNRVIAALDLVNELDATTIWTNITGQQRIIVEMALATIDFSLSIVGGLAHIDVDAVAKVPLEETGEPPAIGNVTIASLNALLNERLSVLDASLYQQNSNAARIQDTLRNNYLSARNFAEFRESQRTVWNNTGVTAAPNSGQNLAFFQVGANSSQGIFFDFETVSRAVSTAGAVVQMIGSALSAPAAGRGIGSGIGVSPMVSMVQSSLDDISRIRANLGAVSNRMDYTQRSLDISSENLQDAESRVRNTDVAREMMAFTMANVLQQASVSMLAQANQMPNNLLQLLR